MKRTAYYIFFTLTIGSLVSEAAVKRPYKTCWCQDFYGTAHPPFAVSNCKECTEEQCEQTYGLGAEAYCGPAWLTRLR
jgi:hypothetical protein